MPASGVKPQEHVSKRVLWLYGLYRLVWIRTHGSERSSQRPAAHSRQHIDTADQTREV